MHSISDSVIHESIPSPRELASLLPLSRQAETTVAAARAAVGHILQGADTRLLVITGPCSVHDEHEALQYAAKLRTLQQELHNEMLLVMRAFCEKPRTCKGWKGLLNDPDLNGMCDIRSGLVRTRRLLLAITSMGVPVAMEMLDPLASSYLADTASWISIGARTVESQIHRDAASGLPVPVGFKNSTGGSVVSAVHAIAAARQSHACLGIDNNGKACIVRTRGNHLCHLVLRGGTDGPNANTRSIETAAHLLRSHGLPEAIIIDCSHMNSGKDHRKQGPVCESAVAMRSMLPVIKGIMLESYLRSGSQVLSESRDSLQYGVSITDSCMSWKETEALLRRIRTYLVESPCTRNPMREQRCAMRQA